MRSTAMEDLFENEAASPDLDGQPKPYNGSSGKNVSLRILSMPSSPLPPPAAGLMPSSPSAISLSSMSARDTRHRSSKDRVSRKTTRVSTISPGGSSGMVAAENFPSTVATIDEGVNDGGNSPTPSSLAPCSNTTVVKKSKVDFVRFDSTEIHYTENEEVRKKISDEIKSVVTAIHQVKQQGSKYKIEKVTNITLNNALESIRSSAWNVKELDLSGNLLSKISDDNLAPFTNLELLNVSSNVLYESVDVRSLTKLETIDLNNNFVTEVLVGPSVHTLHATNNNISSVICYGERHSRGNKRLYLANNKIGSLLSLEDACRSRVEYLDLKLNEIDSLDFGELAASSDTLKYLNLEYNFIFDVKNRQNVVFSQLEKLDLSSNKLVYLGPSFTAVSAAKSINLSNNKLVLLSDVTFSRAVTSFDLRGNGFQCASLRKLFKKNKHLESVSAMTVRDATGRDREICTDTNTYEGPYCCEHLSAPYADRLIDLKRKEHALFSGQRSEQEGVECEQDNNARQRMVDAIKQQYSTTIDEETRRNQIKIQLMQTKKTLEQQLPFVQNAYNELKDELETMANELQISVTEDHDLLQLLRSIVQRYENLYIEEQGKQSNAIRDWDMYQQKETQLLEENARLKKLDGEADTSLQNANATLQDLNVREQNLAKILNKATSSQQES